MKQKLKKSIGYVTGGGGGGGSGTINPGTVPEFAYYSGVTTLDSDPNQRKGAQGTEMRAISWALVDSITDNYYVATTGNDANPGTIGQPFLTIGRAIRQLNMNLRPGKIQINVADGTYNNTRFLAPAILNVDSDATYGQSVVRIVGNSANPANVIFNFDASSIVFAKNSPAALAIDGVTLQSNGLGSGTCGINAINSAVFIRNCIFNNNRIGIYAGPGAFVAIESTAAGGTIDAVDNAIIADGGVIVVQRNLTLTGSRDSAFLARNNGIISLLTGVNTITSGGTTCSNNLRTETGGKIISIGNVTFNLSDAASGPSARAIRAQTGGSFLIGNNCTFNITDASKMGTIQHNSLWQDGGTCTFNALGTTTAEWEVDDNATIINDNVFGGAVTIINTTTAGYQYGLDWRYKNTITGMVDGALPVGVTRYFTNASLVTSFIPLYIATGNEIIDDFSAVTQVGNGAAHTDTYTIMKNGVAQTMTFSITNGSSGSTASNPVSLVAGDQVGIRVETDAATAAVSVTAQISIRKLP